MSNVSGFIDSSVYIVEVEENLNKLKEIIETFNLNGFNNSFYAFNKVIEMAKICINNCRFKIGDKVYFKNDYRMIVNEYDHSFSFRKYAWAEVVGIRPQETGYAISVILDKDWYYDNKKFVLLDSKYIYSIPEEYLEKIQSDKSGLYGLRRIEPDKVIEWPSQSIIESLEEPGCTD